MAPFGFRSDISQPGRSAYLARLADASTRDANPDRMGCANLAHAYAALPEKPDVLVASYHGMPQRYLMEGDPYHCQCYKTTRLVREYLGWDKDRLMVTFQSRFGPTEWLQPYTDETLMELPKKGIKKVAILAPAFSVDCIETLEEIALTAWAQPIGRVRRIPNGIDTAAFAGEPRPDALPGLVKRPGEFWIGTMAGLRSVKNLTALVRASAPLPEFCHLVIVGEGPERDAIRAEAERLGVEHRIHLPGFAAQPERYVGLFDVFSLSSHSEQFPISLVEAMAAGRPVVAYGVGDVADMVSPENRELIVPPGDEAALSAAIGSLVYDLDRRARLRKANRAKARAQFDEAAMIAAYRRLYASALGRATLP